MAVVVVVVAGTAVWTSTNLDATAGGTPHVASGLARTGARAAGCESVRRCRTHAPTGPTGPTTFHGTAPGSTTRPGRGSPGSAPPTPPGPSTTTSTGTAPSPPTTAGTTTTTTTSSTTTTTAASTVQTTSWWRPPVSVEWQWEIDHPLNLSSASDMGTGVTSALGTPAPNPTVYDIDGFDNPETTIASLHAAGDHVICYIEVGAAENYRSDYSAFPSDDLGAVMGGYPSERYLDINDPAVVKVIEARISMCASKGFDAVEPDIDDSYTDATGFTITQSQNVAYDTTLAAYAHSLGLGWALKNGDDPSFAAAMEPVADFALDEQCHQYDTCGSFSPFVAAGKAVLEVEYSLSPAQFCPAADAAGQDAMAMNVNLDGGRLPCR